MSFTTTIKQEILNLSSTKPEILAELSGYIKNNGTINDEVISLTTENINVANKIKNLISNMYNVNIEISETSNVNFSKNILYIIYIKEQVNLILEDLGITDKNKVKLDFPPEFIVSSTDEVKAYLRGVFLTSGSVPDPKTSRYHMEILVKNPNEAVFIQKLLNEYDLNSKIITREKGLMVYLKEAEKISDFLKLLGAVKAVLYFENVRVYRERKNNANRLNNCEQANTEKIIATANIQLEHIKIIEDNLGIDLLDDKTKEILSYRKKYPESSLKELSDIISIETSKSITKSGLNHRFRKIKELAEKINS